jgi:S-adenosylmethionine:tRNA ribosyltransferase-isomerase
LETLCAGGIEIHPLTLHVGPGTFRPIRAARAEDHQMEPEWVELPPATAEAVFRAKAEGRRVIAVGTTVTRALESVAQTGPVQAFTGWVTLFITPGHPFRIVDGLVTNFHLPRSSLLLLVSAFAGRERILAAYRHAVAQAYRFYSYGDAMLIA